MHSTHCCSSMSYEWRMNLRYAYSWDRLTILHIHTDAKVEAFRCFNVIKQVVRVRDPNRRERFITTHHQKLIFTENYAFTATAFFPLRWRHWVVDLTSSGRTVKLMNIRFLRSLPTDSAIYVIEWDTWEFKRNFSGTFSWSEISIDLSN